MIERWADVAEPHFGGYEVSSLGKVRNKKTMRELRPVAHRAGRLRVGLYHKAKFKSFYISRLVAGSFLGPLAPGIHVDHVDYDVTNNSLDNLRIMSAYANSIRRRSRSHAGNSPSLRRIESIIALHEQGLDPIQIRAKLKSPKGAN